MNFIDGTQTISVKHWTHGVILFLFVDFSKAIKNSLRDVSTTKDTIDTQLLQPVRCRVQFPEGAA